MSENKDNRFQSLIKSMMDNADGLMTTKTVVGDPIKVDDTIIIPLSDISIGCAAGSNSADVKDSGMGGFSAKITPTAVLIIRDKITKVVNIKDNTTVNKLLDMAPDIVDRFAARIKGMKMMDEEEAVNLAFPNEEDFEEE
jgi:uncharacterized spore protein YtfJ